MGKYIIQIYKYSQSLLSNLSLKTPVSSSSETQTSSYIELTTTSVPSVKENHQKNMFYIPKIPSRMMQQSQKMITYILVRHPKINCSIPTISRHNHHSHSITTTSSSILNFNTPMMLPLVGK